MGSTSGPAGRIAHPLVVAAALWAAGCAPRGVLVGPTGEHRLVARVPAQGLTMVVTTGSWDGDPPDLPAQFTVVHVLVANLGAQPVRLAPGDFELVSDRGFRYRLLDAGGSFTVARDDDGAAYGPSGAGYPLGRSDDVVTLHSTSRDVHALALPWGYLQPRTDMRGFVYFEKAEDTENHLTLVWHAYDDAGRPLVDLSFPLAVARPRR